MAASDPTTIAEVVVPDADFARPCRGLVIGTGGALSVVMSGDKQTRNFPAVPAGVLPISVTRVNASNTTASGIIALF